MLGSGRSRPHVGRATGLVAPIKAGTATTTTTAKRRIRHNGTTVAQLCVTAGRPAGEFGAEDVKKKEIKLIWKQLPVFSCTDVISSTPVVPPPPFLLSPAMAMPSLHHPETQNLLTFLLRHLNTDLLRLPTILWTQARTASQQPGLVRCGSMGDSRAACQHHRPQMSQRGEIQTLPKNFQYGSYQCEDTIHINQEPVYRPNVYNSVSCIKENYVKGHSWSLLRCLCLQFHTVWKPLSWRTLVPFVI